MKHNNGKLSNIKAETEVSCLHFLFSAATLLSLSCAAVMPHVQESDSSSGLMYKSWFLNPPPNSTVGFAAHLEPGQGCSGEDGE